jgi:fatty acid desaturase
MAAHARLEQPEHYAPRARACAVIGTGLLGLALMSSVFCNVMGFDWKPLTRSTDYYVQQAAEYRLVLAAAVAVCSACVVTFGLTIRWGLAAQAYATWAVVGIVLDVVLLWLAVSGAVGNIQYADRNATYPPPPP